MTIVYCTPQFAHDGRIKILCLDDEVADRIAKEDHYPDVTKRYSPYFAISGVLSLPDLRDVIASSGRYPSKYGYDRIEAPYDVYLLDFRMCDSKEDCRLREHIESGVHAPAAGLLAGMLTALRWPTHPQAIVPYSGHGLEEIGDVWHLCRGFCPESIHLVDVLDSLKI